MNVFHGQDIAPIVTRGLIQPATGIDVTPSTTIDSWSQSAPVSSSAGQYSVALTAGINESATPECSWCQYAAQTPEAIRYAALQWTVQRHALCERLEMSVLNELNA
jgi:hypothetical protein